MTEDNIPKNSAQEKKEPINPSDYVRLEADLISGLSEQKLAEREANHNKVILIYCHSQDILREIAADLKAALEPEVEVLTTSDRAVALKLLKNGEVDLLLHGPGSENLPRIFEEGYNSPVTARGSSLIMMHNPDPVMEAWMNDTGHSLHLTKAITHLNRRSSFKQ